MKDVSPENVVQEATVSEEVLEQSLELQASKQFLTELSSLKNEVYQRRMIMTSILLQQIRMNVRGMLRRYQENQFFVGETIKVTLSNYGKFPKIIYNYSPKLAAYFDAALKEAIALHNKKEEDDKSAEIKEG